MTSTAGMAISCRDLSFSYEEGKRRIPALEKLSLEFEAGTATAVLGPSGSGKSTLLLLLRGLFAPDDGEVLLDGLSPEDARYPAAQRSVGLVFQQAERQLFAASVEEDVAFGPRRLGWTEEQVSGAVAASLEAVGLASGRFGQRHPYSLSGGEQRRLALAGVLAMRPRALLLDEPFVGLDPRARRDLRVILRRLLTEGITLVLVTHDVDQAWELCEHRVVLSEGKVAAAGDWAFEDDGGQLLRAHRLRLPCLVDLWQRLGLPPSEAPRTAGEAAEALT